MSYCSKLTDIQTQYNLLDQLVKNLSQKFSLTPCVGAELEFYLHGAINIDRFEQEIGYHIKAEKGKNQYEIDFPPSQDLANYAKHIEQIRTMIIKSAQNFGGKADFSSKPFVNDYGNSMHIHLNFLEDNNIEKYARILCHYLPYTKSYFLPSPKDYARLDNKFIAPTHIAYGGNNRTMLIRIPDSMPKRLEHRLAAAHASPVIVIYTILKSIENGLSNPDSITPSEKIFGNAFDPQYQLTKITD